MGSNAALTLGDLSQLAWDFVPRRARRLDFLGNWLSWGPAHELGHTLIATNEERNLRDFGLDCAIGFCRCLGERCHVAELAAMRVSKALVTAAGVPALADKELEDTTDFDLMWSRTTWRASWRLVLARRLWPLPRTRVGLEGLLTRRLLAVAGSSMPR